MIRRFTKFGSIARAQQWPSEPVTDRFRAGLAKAFMRNSCRAGWPAGARW